MVRLDALALALSDQSARRTVTFWDTASLFRRPGRRSLVYVNVDVDRDDVDVDDVDVV